MLLIKILENSQLLILDKISQKDTISLTEDGKTITEDLPIAEIFNNYFSNVIRSLCDRNVPTEPGIACSQNIVSTAINKFRNHLSILSINKNMERIGRPSFAFEFVSLEETIKEVNKLSIKKASQTLDIPVKIVKENKDLISYFVYNNFNNALSSSQYPNGVKYPDVRAVFKKEDKSDKSNYRPISILLKLSKVYQRIMQNSIYPYLNKIFSKYQRGFPKGFNVQYCLLEMIEKWGKPLDSGGQAAAVLTDLSKAFDCTDHEFPIAKLNAYRFNNSSLAFITLPVLVLNSYYSGRKQRTKINSSFSCWAEILFGVPQGSILGPLLFNAYICDLFFEVSDLEYASFADDTTPYSCLPEMIHILEKLEKGMQSMFDWFSENFLKANADKCHLIASSKVPVHIQISDIKVTSESRVKLLGIHIDNRLNFDYHVSQLCKKASKKLHALARIFKYVKTSKRSILVNAFIILQFSYCPLIWMFHSRKMECSINRIHERALRLIYPSDSKLTFKELLNKNKTVSIHQKNLQVLATEIFKAKLNISPEISKELFSFNVRNYNFRSQSTLKRIKTNSVYFGSESLSSLAPKIWDLVPDSFKNENSLERFKNRITT